MKKKIILANHVKIAFQTLENQSFKFGYYNYSPMDCTGTKMLAHKFSFEERLPNNDDTIEIGYFNLKENSWNKVAETSVFNWQQGAMLQWVGKDNNKIIFNDLRKNRYISRIIDIRTREEKIMPRAIYAVTPDGKYSISLNFERCYYTRAYSYVNIQDKTWNEKLPKKDGIIKIDLETGDYHTIIPISDIVGRLNENINDTSHWFEHIMLNPSGSRFAFYHRYGENIGYTTKVLTADLEGNNIWEHPLSLIERHTHLGWKNDNSFVVYSIPDSKLKSFWVGDNKNVKKKAKWYVRFYRNFLRPFVPRKIVKKIPKPNSYYALTVDQGHVLKKINPLPDSMDGHPSFTKDGRYMLTDTYADKEGYRHLLIYDLKINKTYLLGKFYSVFNNCEWRADLHPRFSPDEKQIIIDSSHDGYHRMIVLDLDWHQIKKLGNSENHIDE